MFLLHLCVQKSVSKNRQILIMILEVNQVKCTCGRFLTQQTRVVAKMYGLDGTQCLICMSEILNVTYQELLDRYQGIEDCRECAKKKKRLERMRFFNGG